MRRARGQDVTPAACLVLCTTRVGGTLAALPGAELLEGLGI